jgi:dUTPase
MRHPKVPSKLTVWVDRSIVGESTDELVRRYEEAATRHNDAVLLSRYPDSGFDVFTPVGGVEQAGYLVNGSHTQMKLKTGIRCIMGEFHLPSTGSVDDDNESWSMGSEPFYLFPRSSITKTSCRLANNVGIIDSGYRGQLIAVFDVLPAQDGSGYDASEHTQPYSRLVQICRGDLRPFVVEVRVAEEDDVQNIVASTQRGDGGFGSTGK